MKGNWWILELCRVFALPENDCLKTLMRGEDEDLEPNQCIRLRIIVPGAGPIGFTSTQ